MSLKIIPQTPLVSIVNDFRISLTSGVAVTTSDVTNANTIYMTPFKGNLISLWNGTNWQIYMTDEISKALGTLTNKTPYDVFCYQNAGVPTLEFVAWTNTTTRATNLAFQNYVLVKSGDPTRRYLGTFYNPGNQSSTVTMTIAAPGVITYTGHGLSANAPVVFTTTGALPTGITAGVTYYVASATTTTSGMTVNTFQVSATPGGTPITTSGSQSGTHTCTVGTYTEDSVANRYLWNYYNRQPRKMFRNDAATSWNYTTATIRQANASLLNQLNFIIGVNDTPVSFDYKCDATTTLAGTQMFSGLGLDSITAIIDNTNARASIYQPVVTATVPEIYGFSKYFDYPGLGLHYIAMLERSVAAGTTSWYGATSALNGLILG